MSRARKDSNQPRNSILELVRKMDGAFDLFLNGKLGRSNVSEQYLNDELCVRFGFCGEEYNAILSHVKQKGRAEVRF